MSEFYVHNTILSALTYDDLVLMAQNINPANGSIPALLRQELTDLLDSNADDCLALFDEHIEDIMSAAFPDEQVLQRDKRFSEETCEQMAKEIYELFLRHEMWQDVCIYYNGKRMSTSDGNEFRYNGEPFIEEDVDPRNYFEYVCNPHILSMSFEGPVYNCLNNYAGDCGESVAQELLELLSKYGCYYELGNAWNLSCYPG